jgi:hypothetical protein
MTEMLIRRFNQLKLKNKFNNSVNLKMRHLAIMWNENKSDDKYILVVRHPKELIISGYLYHKKCNIEEKWALTENYNYYDIWIERNHFEKHLFNQDVYNKSFFSDNNGTYQEKLNKMEQTEGIKYEMKNVSFNTLIGLYSFPKKDNVLIIKFEDLIYNLKNTLKNICLFLEIENEENHIRLFRKCKSSNILELNKKGKIDKNHITNFNFDKERWKKYWNNELENEFYKLFPIDILEILKY